MNKVSRLLGSTVLATGLIFGGSAGAAVAGDDYKDRDGKSHHSKYVNDHKRGHHHDHSNGYRHAHHHDHDAKGHKYDRAWDGHYKYVYVHNHHDKDCHGKYHRAWYKNYKGEWKFVIYIYLVKY
jgi:hypothetical protein